MAAEWQWTQPWVCTMLEIALPDAAHRVADGLEIRDQRVDLGLVGQQELDVVAAGEAQVAAAVLVGQVGELADLLDAQQPRRAARTVKSLSPDSATWTITPGLRISWYFHFP